MSGRSVVMMVLISLMTTLLVLVHAKDVTTLEYDDLLPAAETNARQRVDTDATAGDHRQGRMSLHTEQPSSKAKREQALRNILAARRRQVLSQRSVESRNTNRTPRPGDGVLKDSPDILEAQETRHGMYVTAPANVKTESSIAEESSESLSGIPEKIVLNSTTGDTSVEFVSKGPEGTQVAEQQTSRKPSDENFMALSIEGKPASGNSRSNYSIGHKNFSSSLSSPTSSSSLSKSADAETRKKNTVSMPESLYNYFRPVESNIPVEDMSQFLYFGQKIQPEVHNTTGNNSVDVTPTVPTAPSSRRRYSMKRFGTTTSVPVPRLEEIINEEMNIAVERQTVEKNKVSKIKNTFRSPENGVYYRKARPTSQTIASNVILTKEPARNATETDARTDLADDKFRDDDDNPSAHAAAQDQLQRERGSAATHVPVETRNATNSTQIPQRQPVSANMYDESTAESEISTKGRAKDTANESVPTSNGVGTTKTMKSQSRRRKIDDANRSEDTEDDHPEEDAKLEDMEMHAEHSEQKITTAVTFDVNTFDVTKKTASTQVNHPRVSSSRENNNIETSTSRDKIHRTTTEQFPLPWTSPETSTLRIIVTEENLEHGSAIGTGSAVKYTVKPVDSTEERVRVVASGDVPPPKVLLATTTVPTTSTTIHPEQTRDTMISRHQGIHSSDEQQMNQHEHHEENKDGDQHHRHQEHQQPQQQQQQQQQQQHVYAYTITNVTRLLRNYTGPGLSREEQGGPRRSTGTAEITTGSPPRRQPPSLLLPRAGSGIEAGRAPAELSAGTTVEAVAAGGVGNLVGERQRKVVAVAPQPQQRAANRTSSLQLTVNKSGGQRTARPTEVTTRGAVRWNHTKTRNSDVDGYNERRFLRKSASAVLNQRIGGNVDDDLPVNKRRRLTNGQGAVLYGGNRRVKGTNLLNKHSEDGTKYRVVNGSMVNGATRKLENGGRIENAVEGRAIQDTMHLELNDRVDSEITRNMTAVNITMEEKNLLASTEEIIDTTTVVSTDIIDEDGSNLTEAATSYSGTVETDTKDKNSVVPGESESVTADVRNQTYDAITSAGTGERADNGNGSSTLTVTETTAGETIAPKETEPTTIPAPVFPVTPRIITEAARSPAEKETFTLRPTESVNQATETKTIEPDKPFGVSHLDPSEIQKMYRSKNVTTENPVISTTTVHVESTTPMANTSKPVDTNSESSTDTSLESRKRVSGERSPEVRGRNLSDKSKDKDDVLPIMHLYNTSDIFNGSGAMDFSHGTERTMDLPVEEKKETEASRPTQKVNDTLGQTRPANEVSNSSRVPLPDLTRKEKHDDNRDVPSQVPPSGPGRGSSFVNGNGNRTRHRPGIYHHAILPDYNGTVYHDELNRTFFETGLIAVSPRESVNISEVISKRHDGDAIASQETVAVVSYILATLVVFPIAVGVGLILRRLILRNRKVLEESDTSSEISCRKDALNLENGDFKTSIEKAITKLPRIQHLCHEAEKPPPPSSQESRWEFPRDKLRLQTVLGQGNFGQVWKAEADDLTGHQGTTRLVAVKTVKEGASDREKEDLVRELEIMQQLGSHPNVVTLLGCCTEEEPHYLILEYVMYGKLLAYLRDHRTRQDFYNFSEDSAALTSRDLTVFGYCVARGMEYLASKKIIHRDLAARNVLVDHNKLCKIADFGMSRFANEDGEVIETRHGRNALPIRWMAPESLIYSLFTTKTDVWSFGILMWEIVTLGSTPYPDMTAREVMRNVQNGYRLERPSHCRSELFRVISRCWHADPDRRPEFQTLRRDLAQLLEDNMNGHYVDLESFASECTD